ncbi:DEAD/DEAH box RNA helicase, putative [Bodo saltans]|uniref:DEAD/DEAH box RNA helicase, putative n=1 Tax=Bodo saltans TaxID=75058 RepID=A0A0S4KI38_BODSA|nr:DEAD/DEAH box RNA helicase, putative [Bodo saltans]|eukprot:CUI14634.1 DEAD/DEAH box RNA helicase, putative [Bodo saltans]
MAPKKNFQTSKPTTTSTNAPKPSAAAPTGGATSNTAGGTQWSNDGSAAGGNVLSWLAQKTNAPTAGAAAAQPTSKGAIEYFKQQQQPAAGGAVPRPRSQQHADPTAPAAPPAPKATPGIGSISELAKLFPQHTAQGGQAKKAAAQQPSTLPQQQRVEQAMFTPPGGPKSRAAPPPPQQPLPAAQSAPSADAAPQTRAQRQQDAKNQKKNQRQQRGAQQFEEARAKAEKAEQEHQKRLETDEEYRKGFEDFKQFQKTQQATQAQFFAQYEHQEQLRVAQFQQERLDIPVILDLVEQHDVVFICTDTGSGKSTSIPKALLEANNTNRIVSTQPRRTATAAIANRVASLRRERVGDDVGYWIRGEKRGDDQTRLWYMTSYTLLLHLLNHPLNPPFTHIILDEFHERQPDVEVTVALLKLCLLHKTAKFKLILMSATLNTDDWQTYFDGLTVATYKQSEPEHPIHDYFMEDVCSMLGMPHVPPIGLTQNVVDQQLLEKHLFTAQNLIMNLNHCVNPEHSILVFLPGRAQVEHFQMWLEMSLSHRVDIIPWHSAVELNVIEAAIQRRPYGKQKIYLATDIAEVSITLPDVVFVIDLVLVKRPQIQLSQPATVMYPPLVVQWISKGSVAQRRGRVGRVQQGFYFCLLSSPLLRLLPDHSAPPIENSRIDELALHALQLVSNPAAIFSICRGQPLVQSIVNAMSTLTQLGCIVKKDGPHSATERIEEVHTNGSWSPLILEEANKIVAEETGATIEEYEFTFIGRLLQLIPVSPQQGMLVFYGFMSGLESLMILAAAVTSSLSPFQIVQEQQQPQQQQRGRKKQNYDSVSRSMEQTEQVMKDMTGSGLRSDIVAIMGAVIKFRLQLNEHGAESPALRVWCRQNHLSLEKLFAIVDLDAHIKFELSTFIPFRDVSDPQVLLSQFEKAAPMVMILTNVAFAAHALEVTSEGSTYAATKEGAVGLFTDLRAVPDLHSPSCLRWEQGDIVVPVSISLHYTRMLVSFSNANRSPKEFWLSVLLFSHHVDYAMFSDDQGMYGVFRLTYCGRSRHVEVDGQTAQLVVEFRKLLSNVCATLRLRYSHKDQFEEDFDNEVLAPRGLQTLVAQQREVMSQLAGNFFGPRLEQIDIYEVEHEDDDLDTTSLLSFKI